MSINTALPGEMDGLTADAEVGLRVHTLMWERRMTQAQLGEKLGLSQTGVGRRLRGTNGWSVADLRATARVLGVTVAYLVGEEGVNPTPGSVKSQPSDYSADHRAPVVSLFSRRELARVAAAH